ncbi:MAG: glycosyltransferase family 39 protein, partial [Ardenticatenales bacterium]
MAPPGRRAAGALAWAVAGLSLALAAQAGLDHVGWAVWASDPDGAVHTRAIVLFSAAAACWVIGLLRMPRLGEPPRPTIVAPDAPDAPPPFDRRRWRLLAAGVALVACTTLVVPLIIAPGSGGLAILRYKEDVVGWTSRSNNTLTWPGLAMWLGGLACALAALREPARLSLVGKAAWVAAHRPRRWSLVAAVVAAVVLGTAAVFRLWDLAHLPLDLTSDHTEKLLDIWDVLHGARPIFLDQNAGREPLQFYMTALLVRIGLPYGFQTQKIGMQLVSIATVPLVYLVGARVAGRRVGLFAAMVVALMPWHLQISRASMRIAWSPFFAALTVACLVAAMGNGRRNAWLALGAALGGGMYGYSGFRPMAIVVTLAVAARLGVALWKRRCGALGAAALRALVFDAASAALVSLLVAAPLIRYAVDRPEFWVRTLTRMAGDEAGALPPVAGLLAHLPVVGRAGALLLDPRFWRNTRQALLMANVTADTAWIHSPPNRPALETVGGALLVLGVVTAVLWAVRRRNWRVALTVLAVPPMLLASILALAYPIEVPHLARAAGALPFAAVLCALPLAVLVGAAEGAFGARGWAAAWIGVAALFVWMARDTVQRTFVEYRVAYDRAAQNTSDGVVAVRSFLADGGTLDHVFLVGWAYGWDYRVFGITFGDPSWNGLLWGAAADGSDAVEQADIHADDPARQLYIIGGPQSDANIRYLQRIFPDSIVAPGAARPNGQPFWIVVVPANAGRAAPGAVGAESGADPATEPAAAMSSDTSAATSA